MFISNEVERLRSSGLNLLISVYLFLPVFLSFHHITTYEKINLSDNIATYAFILISTLFYYRLAIQYIGKLIDFIGGTSRIKYYLNYYIGLMIIFIAIVFIAMQIDTILTIKNNAGNIFNDLKMMSLFSQIVMQLATLSIIAYRIYFKNEFETQDQEIRIEERHDNYEDVDLEALKAKVSPAALRVYENKKDD